MTADHREDYQKYTRLAAVIGTAVIAAAGLVALASCGTTTKAPAPAATPSGPAYSYYRATMGRVYDGRPMIGGTGYGWMIGGTGYGWMMGDIAAPAWMRGNALPGFMMGTTRDPGKIMGALWADAPGPRITPAQAARLGSQIPAGMHTGTLSFTASAPGSYRYLCPVPGHAHKGMAGTFTVR